jgi:uncharacterized protein with LGFP repeats
MTSLLRSIRNALNGIDVPIPFALDDDHIGTEPLVLDQADLIPGGFRDRSLRIRSGEGDYDLVFRITRTPFVVFGAIRGRWEALSAEGGPLGLPTSNEAPTFDGVGRTQGFAGGFVAWHPEIGAHAVWGLIGARWAAIGREAFGYPVTDETPTDDGQGRFNHFRALQLPGRPEATIMWSPATGAHEVYGAIRQKWLELGASSGRLGFPLGAEFDDAGGRRQIFQRGSLFWTPAGGVVLQ